VRFKLSVLHLRVTALGAEIRDFAEWFESAGASAVEDVLTLRLTDGEAVVVGDEPSLPGGRWRRVWRFLGELGIGRIELDRRLESNQVSDVLTLLLAERQSLRAAGRGRATGPASMLRSDDGLAFACTATRIDSGRLTVTYSYCMTRFSRLVRWFKERQTHLRDHRALFRAAPRYAALVGLGPLAVFLLYAVHGSWHLLLVTSVLGSGLLAAATYMFFMTVGSVEYDNEEQAHVLKRAYDQLKLYADRIGLDMERARQVQQRLLPDLDDMPLPDRLEWAASFKSQEEVGGDAFDAALTRDGRVAVIFADVSGHGLGAALITAMIKTTFEAWLERGDGLVNMVRLLNQRLFELTPDQSFAAVAAGLYDPEAGAFSYCNCGHSPHPYLIRASGGAPQALDAAQVMILGVVPELDPQPAVVPLEAGDTVFFATDGMTEARDADDEEFGVERLELSLATHRGHRLPELLGGIVDDVERFTGGSEQADDRTLLAFRVR
jgi:serine phosphatase RsbU (regulator of sigma subunit)